MDFFISNTLHLAIIFCQIFMHVERDSVIGRSGGNILRVVRSKKRIMLRDEKFILVGVGILGICGVWPNGKLCVNLMEGVVIGVSKRRKNSKRIFCIH